MSVANVTFVEYVAPAQSKTAKAPILGAGKVSFDEKGVRIEARRTRKTLAMTLAIIVGLLGIVGAAIGLSALDWKVTSGRFGLIIGIVCGVFPGALVYDLVKDKVPGPPLDVTVSWSQLKILLAPNDGRAAVLFAHPELSGAVILQTTDIESRSALIEGFAPLTVPAPKSA